MKHALRALPCLSAILCALIPVLSCRRPQTDPPDILKTIDCITDQLRAGDVARATAMTDSLKHASIAAGDSLGWAEGMILQGVNAYYACEPERMLATVDSVQRFLARQPLTRRTARMTARGSEIKSSYYEQYHYNRDSSVSHLRRAVSYYELAGNTSSLPQAYANYANSMRMAGHLDSAALYYDKAIALTDSLKLSPSHYISLYNGFAAVFSDMEDYDTADQWWRKSLGLYHVMGPYDKFNTLTGYANTLYYNGRYRESNRTCLRLRAMLDSLPGTEWEHMFNDVNIADSYLRMARDPATAGAVPDVRPMLDSALYYFSTVQSNPTVLAYLHTLQLREALQRRDIPGASRIVAHHPFSDTMRLEQRLSRLEALEDYFEATGQPASALFARRTHDHLTDSLRNYKMRQQVSALNARYEADNRMLSLRAENEHKQSHIYRLLALTGLISFGSIALAAIFFLLRHNQKQREERMLDKIIALRQENLRSRVTPHFIYNALNQELNCSATGRPTHLDALVRLLRRQQYVASQLLIPLSEELGFVDDYIALKRDSLFAPLDYTCSSVPADEAAHLPFPSMVMQILVENAFKHGFPTLPKDQTRILRIKAHHEGGVTTVTVFNNSGSVEAHPDSTGTGLRVVTETMRLINERKLGVMAFTLDPDCDCCGAHGCKATVTLKI